MLTDTTNALLAAVRDPASTDATLNAAAQAFFSAVGNVSRDECGRAMKTISENFNLEPPRRAAFLALVCGALVERGADPSTIAQPLTERLGALLDLSAALVASCTSETPQPTVPIEEGDNEEGDDEDGGNEDGGNEDGADPRAAFEESLRNLAPKMPQHAAAFAALDQFWCAALAVYSASPAARAAARHLRPTAAEIAPYHEGGHWLDLILSVLDDEPIVVIEPATGLGIRGRISGVVDNFQLNVLLMDAFPHPDAPDDHRILPEIVDIARGDGPQQSDIPVTSIWNLYSWQAIEPGFTLPDIGDYASSTWWIWNEGKPEDIPVFHGHRVVLLGPASYPRSWTAQRMFDRLPAKLSIVQQLSPDQVRDWLSQMIATKPIA